MISAFVLLIGAGFAGAWSRRAIRASWWLSSAFALLAWFAGLLTRNQGQMLWIDDWSFLPTVSSGVGFVPQDPEWKMAVFLMSFLLMHLLAQSSESGRMMAPGKPILLLATAIGLCVLLAGSALTLLLLLPVFDILCGILASTGGGTGKPGLDFRSGSLLNATAIVILGVAAWAPGSGLWPSSGVLVALFGVRMAAACAMWRTHEGARLSPEAAVAFLLPFVAGLKVAAEAVRGSLSLSTPSWILALAGIVAAFGLIQAIFGHGKRGPSSLVLAVVSLGTLAAVQPEGTSHLTLGWLAALVFLSGGSLFLLMIRGTEERLWGALGLSLVFLAPILGGGPLATGGDALFFVRAVLVVCACATFWIVLGRSMLALPTVNETPDSLPRVLTRAAMALPAAVGIGIGIRGAAPISGVGVLLASVALAVGGIVLASERHQAPARTRLERVLVWTDFAGIEDLLSRAAAFLGRVVRAGAGLFEGAPGVLWAWALLLALLLLLGEQG